MAILRQVLLLMAVVLVAGAIGFYMGRHSLPEPVTQAAAPAPVRGPVLHTAPVPVPAAPAADVPADAALHISLLIRGLKASDIQDTFDQARGGGVRRHEATDIMAPRGTPVLAVNDGKIVKLFLSKPGGNTIYQFDPSEQYVYYYAHLDRYADDIVAGITVHRGDTIAYVGSTGDANSAAPHLHFAISRLGPEKHWWQATPINPYLYLMNALQSAE